MRSSRKSGYGVKQQEDLPRRNPWASVLLLALLLLGIPGVVGGAQAEAGGRQVVVLVVGYDRAVCNEYGANCRDSELSRAFAATGNALEASLAAAEVQRIDVGQLQLKWLDKDKRVRETRSQALLRALGEASAAVDRDNGRVSALVFVGHGLGAGYIGPAYEGQPLNVMELAQRVGLADHGAIVSLACSVAVRMDLSAAYKHNYHVFATSEYVDWLDSGRVKFAHQSKSMYQPAGRFMLPEQTQYPELRNVEGPRMALPTIQEALLQTLRRTAM
jgi:hypothetical protein